MAEVSDGEGRSEGRPRQEGQPKGRSGQEGTVAFQTTPIFDELTKGTPVTLPEADQLQRCTICLIPRRDHQDRVHAFSPPGAPVDVSQFARKRPQGDQGVDTRATTFQTPVSDAGPSRADVRGVQSGPFDPVLRQALMDKGILTVEDLEQAARKIAVFTNQVTATRGGPDARPGEGSVRPDAAEPRLRRAVGPDA